MWSDPDFTGGRQPLPTFIDEFGRSVLGQMVDGFNYGTAVRSIADIDRWFSPSERKRLEGYGFRLVILEPDVIVAESKHQVLFGRKQPLRSGIVTIPWF